MTWLEQLETQRTRDRRSFIDQMENRDLDKYYENSWRKCTTCKGHGKGPFVNSIGELDDLMECPVCNGKGLTSILNAR
tara:strand:- start:286 stop:519 length:234 start_codon:yes stop_codon:yes gene_type:complete